MEDKRSFLPLWILLCLFLAPVIASIVIHSLNKDKQFSTTQHGIFISPFYLTNSHIEQNLVKNWILIFIQPNSCDDKCKVKKQVLNKLYIALGKDQPRVKLLTIAENELLERNEALVPENVLILNPKGIAIMYYPPDASPSGILKDLRKLLKNSHV